MIKGILSLTGFCIEKSQDYLIALPHKDYDFFAVKLKAVFTNDEIILDKSSIGNLPIEIGHETFAIPFN